MTISLPSVLRSVFIFAAIIGLCGGAQAREKSDIDPEESDGSVYSGEPILVERTVPPPAEPVLPPSPEPVRPSTRPEENPQQPGSSGGGGGQRTSTRQPSSGTAARLAQVKRCQGLMHGLTESVYANSVFLSYLSGNTSLESMLATRTSIGNAWSGITEEGKKLSPAERSVISRVEADLSLKARGTARLLAATAAEAAGQPDAIWKAWALNEIDRQSAANSIYFSELKKSRCR